MLEPGVYWVNSVCVCVCVCALEPTVGPSEVDTGKQACIG